MKRNLLIMSAIVALAVSVGCGEKNTKQQGENPLLQTWNTPYGVPPFDKIKTSDYVPAFEQAIKEHDAEIEAITKVTDPNFENVILAFDRAGALLTRVSNVFFNINEAETNDEMDAISEVITDMTTEHENNIMLNAKIKKKIKAVYEKRNELNLEPDQLRVTEKYYNDFVRNGANLSPEKKEELKNLNVKLANLYLRFGKNVLADSKEFKLFIDNEADLQGLPEDIKAAAADAAEKAGEAGKWLFTTDKPSWIPFLQYAENRDLREKLYQGWFMRGDNNNAYDNKAIIDSIVNLRLQKSQILGYKNFAEYRTAINMAKTPENVMSLLNEVWAVTLPAATKESNEIQKMINKEKNRFEVASWDWWYYAEKIRKAQYDLDENEIKPYFSLDNTIRGIFYVANQLYGITFEKRTDLPVYYPGVETYEAKEKDGSLIGILYMDYYVRPGKRGGAWCTGFREGSYDDQGNRIYPIVSIVCNFNNPVGDAPSLLSFDDNTTLFHEFGHGLHALFSDGRFHRTAGDMPRDMVELPSQILERWAAEPQVLKVYAKHYQTGEVIPDALIKKMEKAATFNMGFETAEYMAASILDMIWHNIEQPQQTDVNAFEKAALNQIRLIPQILPRYRSTYFNHIFTSESYASGYYVYSWAEVLDCDAFNAFKLSGDIFNQDLAAKFRKHVLTECGSGEGMDQYRKFRGQEPSKEPYFKRRGLK
jgi:peptidyl-dipeptidase Dcp